MTPAEKSYERFFDWKWLPLAAWLAVSAGFLLLNRGAYTGAYFDGSDLVRLEEFGRQTSVDFLNAPLGQLTFGLMGKLWRGSPMPYIVVSHVLHILNVGLLILLALELKAGPRTTALAAGVFGIHSGAVEAFWVPGQVAELQCALFVLLTLLAWVKQRPGWSALAFLLAVESNLAAAFLPLALALYVWLIRKDNWRWLGAHGVISTLAIVRLSLSGQVVVQPAAIWSNLNHYMDELLVFSAPGHDAPISKYLVLLLIFVMFSKLQRFSCTLFFALFLPFLLHKGNPGDWSIYLPILGIALFLAFLSDVLSEKAEALMALFSVCLWLLFQIPAYLEAVKETQKNATLAREYVETMATSKLWPGDGRAVLVDDAPPWLGFDGVKAALRLEGITLPVEPVSSKRGITLLNEPSLMLLDWGTHKYLSMAPKYPERAPEAILHFNSGSAVLDLGDGWLPRESESRWAKPMATLRLSRPDWGDRFGIGVDIPKAQVAQLKTIRLGIFANGKRLWFTEFQKPGIWTVDWKANDQEAPAGTSTEYQLKVEPAWMLPKTTVETGLQIRWIGYQNSKWKK